MDAAGLGVLTQHLVRCSGIQLNLQSEFSPIEVIPSRWFVSAIHCLEVYDFRLENVTGCVFME